MGSLNRTPNSNPHALLLSRTEEAALDAIPELRPRFRLSTLLLGVTSCGICLAVARSAPEVAIVLVFVMAIAMIRVLYGIQLHANHGARFSFVQESLLYCLSILVVVAIGGFVVCAFATTLGACLGLGILIANNVDARQTEWIFGGFITGWILGLLAALLTGGWITKMLWFANLSPKKEGLEAS